MARSDQSRAERQANHIFSWLAAGNSGTTTEIARQLHIRTRNTAEWLKMLEATGKIIRTAQPHGRGRPAIIWRAAASDLVDDAVGGATIESNGRAAATLPTPLGSPRENTQEIFPDPPSGPVWDQSGQGNGKKPITPLTAQPGLVHLRLDDPCVAPIESYWRETAPGLPAHAPWSFASEAEELHPGDLVQQAFFCIQQALLREDAGGRGSPEL
jgi:hypothetical protein